MQVGEEYMVRVDSTVQGKGEMPRLMRGKVVWVHPKGRFAELEFQGVNGKFRECFLPERLTEKNRV